MSSPRLASGAASIRGLLLLPLALLILMPIAGYLFIESSVERLYSMAEEQQQELLLQLKARIEAEPESLGNPGIQSSELEPLFVHETADAPVIDGNGTEWASIPAAVFGEAELVQINTTYVPQSLAVTAQLKRDDQQMFLLLNVKDDVVVYREISHISIHRNDHIRLGLIDDNGDFRRFTLAAEQPGQIEAQVVTAGGRALRPEPGITGFWRATGDGYQVEIAIDLALISERFSFNVADVDNFDTRDIQYLVGNQFTDAANELGYLSERPVELARTLQDTLGMPFVVRDAAGNVLVGEPLPDNIQRQHTENLYLDDRLIGSVSVAISDPDIEQFARQARLQLILLSVGLLMAGIVLTLLVSNKIVRRLQDMGQELEAVVDPQGRVQQPMAAANGNDEISLLSRRFAVITRRLQQYNEYLENLSRRLAHELRTPVSVVRSSLEHLENRLPEDDQRYVERAKNGVTRLTNILNSMSEAARLEESLDQDDVIVFELCQVLKGCFEGYENAFKAQQFELSVEAEDIKITGIPELFAQMLDKLIDNAVQFSAADQPVVLRLTEEQDHAVLRISNSGPSLPETMVDQLFDPMISVRDDGQREDSHLGLGLHVARLIAEFHGGSISIKNREDREGAVVSVRLPIMRLTSKLI